jgi:hypothetical protein
MIGFSTGIMDKRENEKHFRSINDWIGPVLLLIVSGLMYLPFIGEISYTKDDWYLMYAGHTEGPSIFWLMYREDRPARAEIFGRIYRIFGDTPIYYHLSGYLFRYLSGLALFWFLNLVWPKQRKANLLIATLFLIYPGFLSQINPIDYQSHLISLCLAMLSLFLTAKAVETPSQLWKLTFTGVSITLGWVYLGLIEFFIGLEVLRWLGIWLIISHQTLGKRASQGKAVLLSWLPSLSVPLGFLTWRLFFFHNTRSATDIALQLGKATQSSSHIVERLTQWLLDTIQVTILAWATPFQNLVMQLDPWMTITGMIVAGVCVLCVLFVLRSWRPDQDDPGDLANFAHLTSKQSNVLALALDWRVEAFSVGLVAAMVGLIPVIIANRQVEFINFSRYSLASSTGVAMMAVAGLHFITGQRVRQIIIAGFIVSAGMTHFANGAKGAKETASMNMFWWQVSWRAPQIRPNTLLITQYPEIIIEEDYFIWGPANLIYYPEVHYNAQNNNLAPISAILLNPKTIDQILYSNLPQASYRRGIATESEYSDLLVITQPFPEACVRVLNGGNPELSQYDSAVIKLLAPRSRLDRVIPDVEPALPPQAVFGSEPEHGWCYYYEKADLARQTGNWQAVASLGDEAWNRSLYPADIVEYVPFLQAYAQLDQQSQLQRIFEIIQERDNLAKEHICPVIKSSTLSNNAQQLVDEYLCHH